MAEVYSILEISLKIKDLLENGLGTVTVEGEISNFRPSAAGHLYFTLKDEKAAISAVMFKGKAWALNFAPKDGMTVRAAGAISLYEKRGTYQIVVEKMEVAGEGGILRLLEERKRKLADEGLFDTARKKPLPFFPKNIAVITSPSGAAVRDIINVATRRNPKICITVLPAIVQGEEAAPALIRQLKIANIHKLADVIIIGRGGGSIEDLLPFSDEEVVRAVAASEIPVISAVGHEIDWALSDFAADKRAPTPSAAAELAVPILENIRENIAVYSSEVEKAIRYKAERVKLLCSNFKPETLEMMFRRIEQPLLMRFDDAKEEMLSGMQERLNKLKQKLALINEILLGANPAEILKRGYSIVTEASTGKTIRAASQTQKGMKLKITTASGEIAAAVEN